MQIVANVETYADLVCALRNRRLDLGLAQLVLDDCAEAGGTGIATGASVAVGGEEWGFRGFGGWGGFEGVEEVAGVGGHRESLQFSVALHNLDPEIAHP